MPILAGFHFLHMTADRLPTPSPYDLSTDNVWSVHLCYRRGHGRSSAEATALIPYSLFPISSWCSSCSSSSLLFLIPTLFLHLPLPSPSSPSSLRPPLRLLSSGGGGKILPTRTELWTIKRRDLDEQLIRWDDWAKSTNLSDARYTGRVCERANALLSTAESAMRGMAADEASEWVNE